MQCPLEARETVEILLAYCAGRTGPETTASLETHVENCPACRDFARRQRAVWEALDTWEATPVSVDFDRRLRRRIEEHERGGWWGWLALPWRGTAIRPVLPLAAACLALVAVFLLGPAGPVNVRQETRAEMVDAAQVERALEDMEMLRQFAEVAPAEAPEPEPI